MQFKRSSLALVDLFQELLAQTRGDGRTMFGCPCGFLGGNMFMGLFGDQLFLRLAEAERARLLSEEGAEVFDPMGGRPMREYVVVPSTWLEGESDAELRAWVAKSACYAATLPPKASRAPNKKKVPVARPSAARLSKAKPAPRRPSRF